MGILYDIFYDALEKKRCTICGCIMEPDSESDICECCKDDLAEGEETD